MTKDQSKTSQTDHRTVITVPHGVDIASADGLSRAVAEALQAGAAEVIVDATGAGRCGLAGIAALARARRDAEAAGSELQIVPGPAVRQAMTSAGPVVRSLLPRTTTLAAVSPHPKTPTDDSRPKTDPPAG